MEKEEKEVVESPRNKYNCLMLKFDIKNWSSFVNNLIEPEDIYLTEKEGYGLELNCHITLLFGIHDYVPLEEVKKYLVPIKFIKCKTNTIDTFQNPKFDVVKFNVEGNYLKQMNKDLRDNIDYTSDYPEYKAHATIAYLNPGTGKKYKRNMSNMLIMKPVSYVYSHADGTKEEFVL